MEWSGFLPSPYQEVGVEQSLPFFLSSPERLKWNGLQLTFFLGEVGVEQSMRSFFFPRLPPVGGRNGLVHSFCSFSQQEAGVDQSIV